MDGRGCPKKDLVDIMGGFWNEHEVSPRLENDALRRTRNVGFWLRARERGATRGTGHRTEVRGDKLLG